MKTVTLPLLILVVTLIGFPSFAQLRNQAYDEAFYEIVDKATPSVAKIYAPSKQQQIGYAVAIDDSHVLTCLDNVLIPEKKTRRKAGEEPPVVEEKPYKKVTLASFKKVAVATLVGYDTHNRLALYLFSSETLALRPISFATESPKIGDFVISADVDSPKVVAGVVSAVNRRIQEKPDINPVPGLYEQIYGESYEAYSPSRHFSKVLQHDTRLDVLSLGTPLVNLNGEMVGLNVCKLIRGTCYAIPNEVLLQKIPLMKEEKILQAPPSGRLGAFFQPVSEEDQINYGMKVLKIIPGSAAEKGGILTGDIILSCDGNKLKEFDLFKDYISSQSPGTKVNLVVLRNDKEVEMPIVIGSN